MVSYLTPSRVEVGEDFSGNEGFGAAGARFKSIYQKYLYKM
jgi:hypothetical protein